MSAQRILESIEKSQRRQANLPEFRPGDSIKVWAKIREGEKTRLQAFEGVCIRRVVEGLAVDVHRPQDLLRRRRRANLPRQLAEHRQGRGASRAAASTRRGCTTCAICRARRRASRSARARTRSAQRPPPRRRSGPRGRAGGRRGGSRRRGGRAQEAAERAQEGHQEGKEDGVAAPRAAVRRPPSVVAEEDRRRRDRRPRDRRRSALKFGASSAQVLWEEKGP